MMKPSVINGPYLRGKSRILHVCSQQTVDGRSSITDLTAPIFGPPVDQGQSGPYRDVISTLSNHYNVCFSA